MRGKGGKRGWNGDLVEQISTKFLKKLVVSMHTKILSKLSINK